MKTLSSVSPPVNVTLPGDVSQIGIASSVRLEIKTQKSKKVESHL